MEGSFLGTALSDLTGWSWGAQTSWLVLGAQGNLDLIYTDRLCQMMSFLSCQGAVQKNPYSIVMILR